MDRILPARRKRDRLYVIACGEESNKAITLREAD
jgi:hypothetical protein